jgi:hypothetical protein
MNLIDRVKNILLKPKQEWQTISQEQPNVQAIITNYVLPLALVAAVATFLGLVLIGTPAGIFRYKSTDLGLYYGIRVLVGSIGSVFLSAFVIDILAPNFGSEKNMDRSIQLVAYSFTPTLLGGIFSIIPSLAVLGMLAGIYGLYLLYIGLPPIKKTKEDQHGTYFVVSLLVMVVVYMIVFYIIGKILAAIFGTAMFGVDSININL